MISIIIPVYNTEKYLRSCLDSVVAQTYQDFEVILVDDGSTDGSGKICDEYAAKDRRIKVCHKKNEGVSSARNKGISLANGEWLFFLDSDDVLYPYTLGTMLGWSSNCELVVGLLDIHIVDSLRADVAERIPKCLIDKCISPKEFIKKVASNRFSLMMEVFPKLFRMSIIKNNRIHFDTNIFYAEDQLFVAEYLCCDEVKSVHVNNLKSVYKYNIRPQSAMSNIMVNFNHRTLTEYIGFYKIHEVYKSKFNNHAINQWTSNTAYGSGMRLLEKMDENISGEEKQKNIDTLSKESNGEFKEVVRCYNCNKSLLEMKSEAKQMSKRERINCVYRWLNSDVCYYKALYPNWRLMYISSHIFGKFGIRFAIDRIHF